MLLSSVCLSVCLYYVILAKCEQPMFYIANIWWINKIFWSIIVKYSWSLFISFFVSYCYGGLQGATKGSMASKWLFNISYIKAGPWIIQIISVGCRILPNKQEDSKAWPTVCWYTSTQEIHQAFCFAEPLTMITCSWQVTSLNLFHTRNNLMLRYLHFHLFLYIIQKYN